MTSDFLSLDTYANEGAVAFCRSFIENSQARYVFGCNEWAKSIADTIEIAGFIDDVTSQQEYCGKPIIRSVEIPAQARVVSAIVGVHPVSVIRKLSALGVESLDYFAFRKYSALPLKEVGFIEDFQREFNENQVWYERLYSSLADHESRYIFECLIKFRLSSDLNFMKEFIDRRDDQYFEPFLNLKPSGESFVDVGCYDGHTTEEFIKRCPNYASVEIFEPEPSNLGRVRARLASHARVHVHGYGAAGGPGVLQFSSNGSASRATSLGDIEVRVESLDRLLATPPTFVKMDIEGAEYDALMGAKQTIKEHHPRLAISVYHKFDDLRRIPELVLSYRSDYALFLRHYTEGVTETVMFFIPRNLSHRA